MFIYNKTSFYMKKFMSVLLALIISLCFLQADAQKVKNTSGDKDILKSEIEINIEFSYDSVSVGKYKSEQDYITAKTEEYNKKEAGKGDTWAASWKNDKESRFEPKFIELFKEHSGMKVVSWRQIHAHL